jgi:preprotein translocase subunit Sec63
MGPRPPVRVLTPAEREARDALNALGARLGPDFSERDLRSAFRQLARRYHPDRHPGCSAGTASSLSRHFADLQAAYRLLARAARADAPRPSGPGAP